MPTPGEAPFIVLESGWTDPKFLISATLGFLAVLLTSFTLWRVHLRRARIELVLVPETSPRMVGVGFKGPTRLREIRGRFELFAYNAGARTGLLMKPIAQVESPTLYLTGAEFSWGSGAVEDTTVFPAHHLDTLAVYVRLAPHNQLPDRDKQALVEFMSLIEKTPPAVRLTYTYVRGASLRSRRTNKPLTKTAHLEVVLNPSRALKEARKRLLEVPGDLTT